MTEQPPAGGRVRVRFAPSPSGDLHVGNIRTALYDWAFARHTGGTFVLRIEDTDQSRVTSAYIASALDTLRWLGLEWDEGPEAGGPYGPYLQSERIGSYADWVARLLADGHAYLLLHPRGTGRAPGRRPRAWRAAPAATTATAAPSPPAGLSPAYQADGPHGRWSGSGCRRVPRRSRTWSAVRSPSITRMSRTSCWPGRMARRCTR